jgi:ribosomal protein S18 acetylase RimI-like enzyme
MHASNAQDFALLDHPIWHSLTTTHAHLALGTSLARRYPPEIGPLAALREPTPEAYAELAALTPAGDVVVLFLDEKPTTPIGWELVRDGRLVQMLCPVAPDVPATDHPLIPLSPFDFPEMVDLAKLTEPGPFRALTAELGSFLGIRVDGRLAAMAGERLAPTGFTEVSAVCTHPEFRGRGYAQALVAESTRNIHATGRMPFLTSFEHNASAVRVYQRLGFSIRRSFELAVLRPPQR